MNAGVVPMLPEITQTILRAKSAKNLTFAELAGKVGCNPVFLATACYRQASLSHEQAVKLLEALGLGQVYLPDLTDFPVKGGLMPTVPIDPLLYRFYEIMQVYGLPLKDVIQANFGDGIKEQAIPISPCRSREGSRPQGRPGQDHHVGQVSPYKKW